MSEDTTLPPGSRSRKRVRRSHKHKSRKRTEWLVNFVPALLFLIVLIFSAIPLFDPFLSFTNASQVLSDTPLRFLVSGNRSQVLGGVVFFLSAIIGTVWLRFRVVSQEKWLDRLCPKCQQSGLKRIHRKWHSKLLGRFGIPIRRYICPNCHWRGLRIDESKV